MKKASLDPASPGPRPMRLRQLVLAVFVTWAGCAAALLALFLQHERGVQHFEPVAFLLPMVTQFGGLLIALGIVVANLIRGRRPGRSLFWGVVALGPLLFWTAVGVYGFRNWAVRHVPNDYLMNVAKQAGASLMEAQARWAFPYQEASDRIVMFHHGVSDPDRDLTQMERHIEFLERVLERPQRDRIHWVRGPLLGLDGLSLYGLAVWTPDPARSEDSIDPIDRHEAAHAFLDQQLPPDADIPTVLSEGWAEAIQAGWLGPNEVAEAPIWTSYRALDDDSQIPALPELFGPRWYHQDSGPVYSIGPHLVRYLIQRHGSANFLDLCASIRPNTANQTFQQIYRMDLEELKAAMQAEARRFAETESRSTRPEPPPSNRKGEHAESPEAGTSRS